MADDTALSSMYVKLGLDTLEFERGANNARKIADDTAGGIDKSFASISEGRGGLMLTEEALGVRLPRHLNSLLAKIPGVASAFSAILPIAGVVVALEILGKVIEKHEELAAAQQKASTESANLANKMDDSSKSMELANLKLEDQIAKLEGRPNSNRLKEALLESSIAADRLAASFATDFDRINGDLLKSTGFMKNIETGLGLIAEHPISLFTGDSGDKLDEMNAGVHLLVSQMILVQGAQRDMMKAGTQDEQIKGLKAEQFEYQSVAMAAEAALAIVKRDTPDNIELIAQLSQEWTNAETAIKNTGGQIKNTEDRMKEAALQTAKDASDSAEKVVNAEISGDEKIRNSKIELWEATQSLQLAGVEKTAEVEAALEAIHIAGMKREQASQMQAAAQHLTVLQHAFTKDEAAITAAQEAIVAMTAAFQAKLINIEAAGKNRIYAADQEADRKALEEKKKAAEIQNRIAEESLRHDEAMIKLQLGIDDEAAKHSLKMTQTTAQQELAAELAALGAEYDAQYAAYQKARAQIDTSDAAGLAKQKAMDHKQEEEAQAHALKMQQIIDKEEQDKAKAIEAAESKVGAAFANTAAKSIVEGKSMGAAFKSLGKQMLETALANFLQMEMLDERQKLKSAATSARGAWTGVMNMELPPMIGYPLAVASAAAAFAGIMAFEQGGIVPHDAMAMVHKDEMVLPPHIANALLQQNNSGAGGGDMHFHHNPRYNISTVDSKGFGELLKTHNKEFTKHVHAEMRRQNR